MTKVSKTFNRRRAPLGDHFITTKLMKQSLFIKIHNNIVTNKKMALNPLSANLIDAHCYILSVQHFYFCYFQALYLSGIILTYTDIIK